MFKMVAFGNIESMTIERFHREYLSSNGDKKFRNVNIGEYTVDLLKMVARLTKDADKKGEEWKVLRGQTISRPRPEGNKKFSGSIFEKRYKGF